MKFRYFLPLLTLAATTASAEETTEENKETNFIPYADYIIDNNVSDSAIVDANLPFTGTNTNFNFLNTAKDFDLYQIKKGLSFDFTATQFTRDAEYFLPETKGYTAVGFMATPTVRYVGRFIPFSIEAGAHVLGIAGDDHRLHLNPVFTIEYQPKEWLCIIGGTIYGNLNHGLYEPMYDFDRYFYNNQEDGLQLLLHKKWGSVDYSGDTWLNWENFLEPGEAEQEKFTIGSRNNFTFTSSSKNKFVSIPLHIMGTHRGGQFSALQDTCLETIFNACTGIDWSINQHWRLTGLFFGYKNNSNEVLTPYKNGYGLYPMVTYSYKNMSLIGGYWYGNGYIGARGSHLFMSVSKYDPAFAQKERNMITGKWYYQHGILGIDAQTYYDLDESKCDFAFGIYLKIDKGTRLSNKDKFVPNFKF